MIEIPSKCKICIHKKNDYCKAYQCKIGLINTKNCKRRKITKSRKNRRSIKNG